LFCPKHGAQFDLRTGAPIGRLAKGALHTFKIRVDERGKIEIELPERNGGGAAGPMREYPAMSAEQMNKNIVARFLQEFSTGAVDNTMAMMTEDATWWVAGSMPISGTYDKPAFTRLLSGVLETCSGPIRITPKSFVAMLRWKRNHIRRPEAAAHTTICITSSLPYATEKSRASKSIWIPCTPIRFFARHRTGETAMLPYHIAGQTAF
jgi:hypothetical protein